MPVFKIKNASEMERFLKCLGWQKIANSRDNMLGWSPMIGIHPTSCIYRQGSLVCNLSYGNKCNFLGEYSKIALFYPLRVCAKEEYLYNKRYTPEGCFRVELCQDHSTATEIKETDFFCTIFLGNLDKEVFTSSLFDNWDNWDKEKEDE